MTRSEQAVHSRRIRSAASLAPAVLSLAIAWAIAPAAHAAESFHPRSESDVVYLADASGASKATPASKFPALVVEGEAEKGYDSKRIRSATKTSTLLRDIPQSISVVPAQLMRDTAMQSMSDAMRYVPGIGFAQGEGNRDTPVIRGNATTADFFVDGIRDDVQYFRDIYNIERVEALKGPNAMIFGRGGAGGLINRVSKQADWNRERQVSLLAGSWNNRRATVDFGDAINDSAAFRVTGLVEDSESYRDEFELERWGINPTFALRADDDTTIVLGYEHFRDERVADRGVPSYLGQPLDVDPSTFFGDPERSTAQTTVDAFNARIEHQFGENIELVNQTRYARYDKFYQNVFPGVVSAAGTQVAVSAYNNATTRENLFNQTDLTFGFEAGGIWHGMLVGAELGRQDTENLRMTGFFTSIGANVASVQVPIGNPRTRLPLTFRPNATDADNRGSADTAAVYVQDQIEFSPHWLMVLGVRFDHFAVDFHNNRIGADFSVSDSPLSPRAGLIYKPIETVSLYASYALAFLPRAGEQLSSLSLTNQALDPEEFENVEFGAKWDVSDTLSASAAIYRLDRSNVAVPDPTDPAITILVDAQRTQGVELGLTGELTESWQVVGGSAYQDGEITKTISATAREGATLAQLPKHSASVWNRYAFSDTWGVGLGAIYRSESFTSTDNTVRLPGYTRIDAALFFTPSETLQIQLNVENLGDREYFPSAHSNTNITPGSPLAVRLGVTAMF